MTGTVARPVTTSPNPAVATTRGRVHPGHEPQPVHPVDDHAGDQPEGQPPDHEGGIDERDDPRVGRQGDGEQGQRTPEDAVAGEGDHPGRPDRPERAAHPGPGIALRRARGGARPGRGPLVSRVRGYRLAAVARPARPLGGCRGRAPSARPQVQLVVIHEERTSSTTWRSGGAGSAGSSPDGALELRQGTAAAPVASERYAAPAGLPPPCPRPPPPGRLGGASGTGARPTGGRRGARRRPGRVRVPARRRSGRWWSRDGCRSTRRHGDGVHTGHGGHA